MTKLFDYQKRWIFEHSKDSKLVLISTRRSGNSFFWKLWNQINEFIKNGVCQNNGSVPCNLGYACDACPFYPKNQQYAREKVIFT